MDFARFMRSLSNFFYVWNRKEGGIKVIFNALANDCAEDLYLLL